ncbi:hypothetical protein ACFPL7_03500 [Dongia soli]|uniref:Uncharacterized protein n=1 Tax=Dongia soli TaxID=600628 RepID=A0ABU5EF56_9PROT|nr:hypothetical protein [Dongia soli]MDY0884644.1 hypothetical protein [Dongia soli]
MGWGTAIGVIVVGNLLYFGLRAWLGRGIRPGMFGQVSDLATKRLTAELIRLDLPDHAVIALGRIEGPALARQIHKSLMHMSTIEEAYIEEFTAALSLRVRRFAETCALRFRTETGSAAQYEEDFQAYRLWYGNFIDGACEANPLLGLMPDGSSLCDDLNADLLFDAFDAGFDPARLGRRLADETMPVGNITPDYLDGVLRRLLAEQASPTEDGAGSEGGNPRHQYAPVRAAS